MFNNVFSKIMPFMRQSGQATDNNMAHVYCMQDKQVLKHTLRIRNTY
jgi:hypothetical protein